MKEKDRDIYEEEEEDEEEVETSFEKFQRYGRNAAPTITLATLGLICFLAFIIRIFSVIRFEVIIHEFDPWFNFIGYVIPFCFLWILEISVYF